MAPAPRTSGRRRPSTSSSSASRRRTLLIAGGVVLAAVVVYVLYRRRSSSSSTLDTSGTPGPDRTASSIGPSGGAAGGDAGQLPVSLVSQPDPVQTQVQQTDAGGTANASTAAAVASSQPLQPAFQYGPGSPLGYYEVGSQYYQQSSPGSSTVVALPPSHPNAVGSGMPVASMLPDAFAGTNVRRPGVQPD